jgi:hypothetical protein
MIRPLLITLWVSSALSGAEHKLKASPDSIVWGNYWATLEWALLWADPWNERVWERALGRGRKRGPGVADQEPSPTLPTADP